MATHRPDVSNLNGIVIRELILNCKIYGLNIRSLEIVLAPIQIQPLTTIDRRILNVD